MITITSISDIQDAEKALFFLTKAGCSNCSQTKTLVERFEAENADVSVFTYEAKSATDEIANYFPPVKMFPGCFMLKKGKVVSATNSIPPYESFAFGLADINSKKITAYDTDRMIKKMTDELKNAQGMLQFITESIMLEEMPTAPSTEDFELPTVTATTKEADICESCT